MSSVYNMTPGALHMLWDPFFCGYAPEGVSEGQEGGLSAVASTPVPCILPEAISHQAVFEMGRG